MLKDLYKRETNNEVYSNNSSGSYTDDYVKWLEEKVSNLNQHNASGRSEQLKVIEELIDLAQDCCTAERIDYLHSIINRL